MSMEYDKINNEVAFRESDHRYFNVKHPDRQYLSVTTMISKYHEKFDADFWSTYKAIEHVMGGEFKPSGAQAALLKRKKFDPDMLSLYDIDIAGYEAFKQSELDRYQLANTVACERGTAIHQDKENRFYEKRYHTFFEHNINLDIDKSFQAVRHDFSLNEEFKVLPEYLVYYSDESGYLNMAGQMDLLVKNGNDIYILDYKTNAKGIETKAYYNRATKQFKKMYHPIQNLDDHTLNHYTLQLSIYAWMLQKINPEFNIKLLMILHQDGEGNETEYILDYLKDEVEKLMQHQAKQNKIAELRGN